MAVINTTHAYDHEKLADCNWFQSQIWLSVILSFLYTVSISKTVQK